MVRVNSSPGGGGRLSETAREPQTVRVLKPPGGGSSISFGDDPVPIKKTSVTSNSGSVPASNDTPTPNDVAATPSNGSISPTKSEEVPSSTPDSPTKEIAAPAEEPAPAVEIPKVPEENSPVKEQVAASPEKTNGTISNDSTTPSPKDQICIDISVEKLSLEAECKDFPTPVDSLATPEVKTNGNHENGTNPDVVSVDRTPDIVVSHNDSPKNHNLPPLKIETPKIPPTESPRSSGVVSPSSSNGDTKGSASPQGETPARKIKDHMRSNIFAASTEDYPTTRSSRANVSVVTPEANVVSNAGQRGRNPPGGFSTKLW